ncbi:hypothetical protein [Rhodococcus sp. T7]|uniref:hypothetical protein n=1 Tax=Rhodococcus sp. T7 TaxID=627444 RepID=UPI003FA6E99C
MPVPVSEVDTGIGAFAEAGTTRSVGLGTHQRIDERGQQDAQQLGANTRVTLVGLSQSHAMAAFLGYDTPVRFGSGSYTTLLDATASSMTLQQGRD